jgi:hypothetical protein
MYKFGQKRGGLISQYNTPGHPYFCTKYAVLSKLIDYVARCDNYGPELRQTQ